MSSTWRRVGRAVTAMLVILGALAPAAWGQDEPAPGDVVPPGGEVVHSWALAPTGSDDPDAAGNRPNLSYEVDPGAELQDAVTLYNFSNVLLTFRVYPTDALNNADGQFDLLPRDEQPTDVGTWITLPQERISVAPGAQVTMPITVKVPADASPGDHSGAILASNEAVGSGPDGKTVTLDRRTGTRVYVRVAGALTPELAVEDLHTTYRPALYPLGGSAEVSYRIQNRGNVRLSGAHSVSISGPFGVATQRVPSEDLAELLPGEGVTVHASFDGVPAAGLVSTRVRLEPAGGGDDELAVVTRRATTLAPPITLVMLALAVLLARWARRSYRRHRLDERGLEVQPT